MGDLQTSQDYLIHVGPVWGFQCTYTSWFNLGLDLGAGYLFDNVDGVITPIIDFSLGWALGK